ncbi:hypothetical protein DV711_04605 [Motiliproteus coralliicola]|uniref:Uncharacterized protein n=1 Tax=Motiliproteus coralliicola TaxID=2283196 RepID=A0A369WT66_9GAMM|nr:hypothetical protein DV711_04605 [Motiliproteus coralliicola]
MLALLLVHSPHALASLEGADRLADRSQHWQRLYGDSIKFEVWRDGEPVGSYQTRFGGGSEQFRVEAEMELELSWLWWRYRYQYQAVELWRQGHLSRLSSRIDDNGELVQHHFSRQGDWLVETDASMAPVESGGAASVPLPVLASHHYDIAVLHQGRVLNTLTGQVNRFEIEPLGAMRIASAQGQIEARGYRYRGELHDTEVWYDNRNRWVGLRFKDRRGATVEFRCQRCGRDRSSDNRLMQSPSTGEWVRPPSGRVLNPSQSPGSLNLRWQL